MTPEESEVLDYLGERNYASTHTLARRFRKTLDAIDLVMRSLLSHGQVEEDAKRYYRITEKGIEALDEFAKHFKIRPFDGTRRVV